MTDLGGDRVHSRGHMFGRAQVGVQALLLQGADALPDAAAIVQTPAPGGPTS